MTVENRQRLTEGEQNPAKVDKWTQFVHCHPPPLSKTAGQSPYMIEYKIIK